MPPLPVLCGRHVCYEGGVCGDPAAGKCVRPSLQQPSRPCASRHVSNLRIIVTVVTVIWDRGSSSPSAQRTAVFRVRYFLIKVCVSFLELTRLHTSQATTWGKRRWNGSSPAGFTAVCTPALVWSCTSSIPDSPAALRCWTPGLVRVHRWRPWPRAAGRHTEMPWSGRLANPRLRA